MSSQQIYYGYTTITSTDNFDTTQFEYTKQVSFNSTFQTIPIIVASVSTIGQGASGNDT
jgi:hypothetical protein